MSFQKNESKNEKASLRPNDTSFKSSGGQATQEKFKNDSGIQIPQINLPKGGGAIKSIDEKFSVNAINGTSTFNISLPLSAARGFSLPLGISYNSGGGNGIFGLGWSLKLHSICRRTDKQLPQYHYKNINSK